MELKYLGKRIIAAVAQRPFPSKSNNGIFCKLIPVFNHLDRYDTGFSEPFHNDGEIWWMLRSVHPLGVVPGMLVEATLECAPNFDAANSDSSAYQVQSLQMDGNTKMGAEIFNLIGESEKTMGRFKGDGGEVVLPHVPTRIIYIRAAGFVYGPFSTAVRDNTAEDLSARVMVSPCLKGRAVYRLSVDKFASAYKTLKKDESVSANKQPRSKSAEMRSISWEFISPEGLRQIESDYGSAWELLDFESLASKISRIANSVDDFGRKDRQEARKLIERLEQSATKVDDPAQLRNAVEGIKEVTESVDQSVRALAQVLMENGLLNEDRLREAEKSYLDKWIETQTDEVNKAIADRQNKLDALEQEISAKKQSFEFESQRRENELKKRMDGELEELDQLKQEELKKIQQERAGWEAERGKLMTQVAADREAVDEMLKKIQGSAEDSAVAAIRLYPFLGKVAPAEVQKPEGAPKESSPVQETREFCIPNLLKSGCKGARITVDQQTFLSQLRDVAESSGLHYDPDDLRRFHTSVLCEGLTILAGPSGVGKSSLARLYGSVLSGGEDSPRDGTHVVTVGPSWLERSDLLGYVNTVTGEFAPSETGVFQRLIYACEDFRANGGDAGLYPFCLDEMNLSQIEHYFNDFMQLLEQRPKERMLKCFSAEAVKPDSMFLKYATLQIAPSVRFIGTVNFDETTRRMSSRLLDRVNLVCLSEVASVQVRGKHERMGIGGGISYATYSSWAKNGGSLSPDAETCLRELAPALRTLETAVSPRVREAMKRYIATTVPLIENSMEAERIAFDEQIAQRVLSKVRSINSGRQAKALDEVEGILSNYCGSSMAQSSRIIASLREQERPFEFDGSMD